MSRTSFHSPPAMPVGIHEIERAYRGDRQARRVLAERLLPAIRGAVTRRLFSFARAQARDPADERDDLVHGVWVRLVQKDWRVLRRFDATRGTLESYVCTIADRHVQSVFRSKASNPYAILTMENENLEERSGPDLAMEDQVCASAELLELVQFLGQHLDERGMLVFRLLEVDGLPVPDVCLRAEMSRDALYQRRTRLRRVMNEWRRKRK